ncbi:CBL-interacting protein kinase 1 [Platanthera guangdongensis]|uniref:non-specific serine/threonine protein kinase n=1 Tax=Platanthera guangdongensis TaxID=2320717 RepID=A0ABR2LGX8_9ASPA
MCTHHHARCDALSAIGWLHCTAKLGTPQFGEDLTCNMQLDVGSKQIHVAICSIGYIERAHKFWHMRLFVRRFSSSQSKISSILQVSASKTKIYMVLEYVNGGELFDKIEKKGRLPEQIGLKLFQQLIDGISYCHDRGVYHRDLKPENVLVDAEGKLKISDFGLGALSQNLGNDGLLHTTCGSPNYIAPEVLANRGYDGAVSDIWSCGVILYIILTGALPFDDRNLAVLYQKIVKGDTQIPKYLSKGAQSMLKRILDPNPLTRVTASEIREDVWFKQDYAPAVPSDDDPCIYDEPPSLKHPNDPDERRNTPTLINAFQLIGMSSSLDLSGFFEQEDVSERKVRFTSNYSPKTLFEKIQEIVTDMGFQVQNGNGKQLKVMLQTRGSTSPRNSGSLSIAAELCSKISDDLGIYKSDPLLKHMSLLPELSQHEGDIFVRAV